VRYFSAHSTAAFPEGSLSLLLWMFRALLLLLAQDALSLQIAVRPLAPATLSRSPAVHAQFGGGEKPKGLSRDSEPEEFFKTNMGARTATARGHFARAPSHLAQCSASQTRCRTRRS